MSLSWNVARSAVAFVWLFAAASIADAAERGASPEEPSSSVVRSVVKVWAKDCEGRESRSATGFVWGNSSQVVTSMHVVAGCRTLHVYYEQLGARRIAPLRKVLRRADLALLDVQDPPAAPPLKGLTEHPTGSQQLYAIGYYFDIPTANRKSLTRGLAGKRLRDIIPSSVRHELETLGYPDVDLEIINLEGHLLPGMSGAPIVDASGTLVGVANGGLEKGAAAASWGIPVRYLDQLTGSQDAIPTSMSRRRLEALFAAELTAEEGIKIRCGELEFQHVRTRPFPEIAASSDDRVGLSQLATALGFVAPSFDVNIYQHLESGATIVVPAGLRLVSGKVNCYATAADGLLRLTVHTAYLKADPASQQAWLTEVQDATVIFETRAFHQVAAWQVDPQWSYWQPQVRQHGLVVRRKAAGLFSQPNPWNIPGSYAFETLAAYGSAVLAVIAKNDDNLRQQLCLRQLSPDPCPHSTDLSTWAQMILSTHMATFPSI